MRTETDPRRIMTWLKRDSLRGRGLGWVGGGGGLGGLWLKWNEWFCKDDLMWGEKGTNTHTHPNRIPRLPSMWSSHCSSLVSLIVIQSVKRVAITVLVEISFEVFLASNDLDAKFQYRVDTGSLSAFMAATQTIELHQLLHFNNNMWVGLKESSIKE